MSRFLCSSLGFLMALFLIGCDNASVISSENSEVVITTDYLTGKRALVAYDNEDLRKFYESPHWLLADLDRANTLAVDEPINTIPFDDIINETKYQKLTNSEVTHEIASCINAIDRSLGASGAMRDLVSYRDTLLTDKDNQYAVIEVEYPNLTESQRTMPVLIFFRPNDCSVMKVVPINGLSQVKFHFWEEREFYKTARPFDYSGIISNRLLSRLPNLYSVFYNDDQIILSVVRAGLSATRVDVFLSIDEQFNLSVFSSIGEPADWIDRFSQNGNSYFIRADENRSVFSGQLIIGGDEIKTSLMPAPIYYGYKNMATPEFGCNPNVQESCP